jgi:hypothetical protein
MEGGLSGRSLEIFHSTHVHEKFATYLDAPLLGQDALLLLLLLPLQLERSISGFEFMD